MIFQDLIDICPERFYFKFVSDYLFNLARKYNINSREFVEYAALHDLVSNLYNLKEFKPFLCPVDQIIEFLYAKINSEDFSVFNTIKMPFEKIFIDFNGTLYEDEKIKGLIIKRIKKEYIKNTNFGGIMIFAITPNMHNLIINEISRINSKNENELFQEFERQAKNDNNILQRLTQNAPLSYIPLVDDVNKIDKSFMDKENNNLMQSLVKIVIGFCLYVNSINIEVIKIESGQTKKRKKQNKPIPEPYYFCKLERREVARTDNPEEGTKHKYQYDVRGHFKHFKYGKMKGRILWCPPHRRGLSNTIYRPKTYIVTK